MGAAVSKQTNAKDEQSKMQTELADKLLPIFEAVCRERQGYYETHPVPDLKTVDAIITSYSYKCGSIAFGCNLVPGPWGMLAIVPEIALVIREQLKMVYDIARAFGHEKITTELLLGVLLSGVGSGIGGVIIIQGSKVVVKRATLRMIQRLVAALGGKITQRVLKSILARWVPFLGAAALGAWAKHSTKKLGLLAKEIFAKTISFDETVVDGEAETESQAANVAGLLTQKIRLMISMAWMDRSVHEKEREIIEELLEDSDLADKDLAELKQSLKSGKVAAVDYAEFTGREDEKIATVMDLILLMKIDDHVHPAERLFVKKVAQEMGLPATDIEEMIGHS